MKKKYFLFIFKKVLVKFEKTWYYIAMKGRKTY